MKRQAILPWGRWISVLLCLLLCLPSGALALEQSEQFYANDPAGVLSSDTERYICDENYRLYDQCSGAEVVVVAVDFLGGRTSEEYAYEVFNDWGLGSPDEDNGVLILLSPGEEKYWIMTGDGLTGQLSPGALDNICSRYMEDDFDAGDYDKAALNTFKAVVAAVDEKYGVSESDIDAYYGGGTTAEPYAPQPETESGGSGVVALVMTVVILFVVVVIVISIISSFRSIGRRRVYGAPVVRPRRTFWGFGRPMRPRPPMPPPPPRPHDPPRGSGSRPGGGLFGGGSSSAGRRSSGGGSSRGGGAGRR